MANLKALVTNRFSRLALVAFIGAAIAACTPTRDDARPMEEDAPRVSYEFSNNEGLVDASFQAEVYCRQYNAWPEIEEVDQRRRGRGGEVTFTCKQERVQETESRSLPRGSALNYNYHDQQSLIEATMEAQRHCAKHGAEARPVTNGLDEDRRSVRFECVRSY
ncbi:hypothetical protein [Marinimicrobium sp. ABcell2]|uniref:hypothetical protein n=1 Tax=Marinimicrobium sp. ABcell2 TaxID=3069751 RepID=UPI0027B1ADF9|nr:hypothetical protein [Marinimicrobium sp. ABcell2]MDQ2075963.1 hypothetical protein [Marinimicrobium sp. ABcell2]